MHDFPTKPHIFGYGMSRSRSLLKVKVITFDHIELVDIWCTSVSHEAAGFEW